MTHKFIKDIHSGSRNDLLKREIICYYINNRESTLADLGKEMNLSIPTVTKLVGELIDDGYVVDYGKLETAGGRRPNIYGLNQDSGFFVGVDIHYTGVSIGLINFSGTLMASDINLPFQVDNSRERFDELCGLIDDFIEDCKVPRTKIINIGINIPGRVNTKTGQSYSYFYFDERPLSELFTDKLGINATIDNDTRAMTYGEFLTGSVKGEKDIIYLNVGWGLGMGMIINGELYYGKSGFSGEFGHYPTFENEVLCQCGKIGCLETEASGQYIHREFINRLNDGDMSILSEAYNNGDKLTIYDIIDAALKDDMMAIELIEDVGNTLGKALAGLINIFNPELVVIGGTVSKGGDYLLLPLRSSIKRYSLNMVSSDSKLKLSKLGDKAGIIGASMLARSKTIGLI